MDDRMKEWHVLDDTKENRTVLGLSPQGLFRAQSRRSFEDTNVVVGSPK